MARSRQQWFRGCGENFKVKRVMLDKEEPGID